MGNHLVPIDTILSSVEALSPAELDVLQARIARSRKARIAATHGDSERSVFRIPYDEYLQMPDDERETVHWRVYREHHDWYQAELKARRAQWILVCGSEIVEASHTLDDYPTPEKLHTIGQERGFIPFVFVPKPLIEESSWSTLGKDDFYPTLKLQFSSVHETQRLARSTNPEIDADFDTGSPCLFVDYDKLSASSVLSFRSKAEAYFEQHLGQAYRFHILPLQVSVTDEKGHLIAHRMHAYCVRDWRNSSLCLVNPNRQALAGRNLLLKFSVKVELDGQKKRTRVLGARSRTPKQK